jgi:group I intron endonuclease
MEVISAIYGIRSICKPDRVYIGSAVNIRKRWNEHLNELRLAIHHSPKLQRHYNKYGKDDLVFEIIIQHDRNELIELEQTFMDLYKPYFNCSPTAGSTLGTKFSPEICAMLSKLREGNHNMLGKHHTPETRAEMSRTRKGRVRSLESRLKTSGINNCNYGKPMPEETKDKIRQKRLGQKWTPEARQRMSRDRKGRICSPEALRHMSENNGRNKLIINLETGIYYRSIIEAAASMGKKRYWLADKLNGKTRNTSMFRYA